MIVDLESPHLLIAAGWERPGVQREAAIASGLALHAALVQAALENAQRFSTRAMVPGYLQCYAVIAGSAARKPNGLVAESGRGA